MCECECECECVCVCMCVCVCVCVCLSISDAWLKINAFCRLTLCLGAIVLSGELFCIEEWWAIVLGVSTASPCGCEYICQCMDPPTMLQCATSAVNK